MTKNYSEILNKQGAFSPKNNVEKDSQYQFLNIWEEDIPSFKDIRTSILKSGIFMLLGIVYLITMFLISKNLMVAIGVMLGYFLFFIIIFRDKFDNLKRLFHFRSYNSFRNFEFWQFQGDTSIVLIRNRYEYTTTALRILQVEILPENVKGNLKKLIKALAIAYIPFTYQIVQKPLLSSLNDESSFQYESNRFKTLIYFTIFYDLQGSITSQKFQTFIDKLNSYTISLKNNLHSNFHHYRVVDLKDTALIDALRTSFLKKEPKNERNQEKTSQEANKYRKKKNALRLAIKIIFILILVFTADALLAKLQVNLFLRVTFFGIFIGLIISQWCYELLEVITLRKSILFKSDKFRYFDLFEGISFYKVTGSKNTLFFQGNNSILGGMKQLHLTFAIAPLISAPNKFYQALIEAGIPFTYTIQCLPTSFYNFEKKCRKYLKIREQKRILKKVLSTANENNWLQMRGGIWRVMLTLSTSYAEFSQDITIDRLEMIESVLNTNIEIAKNAFISNFPNCNLELLQSKSLESGVLFEAFKNNRFTRYGTHLNSIVLQGYDLISLTWLADEFKKGIETKIAAEFNSPLHLENFITIGYTINTETLTREIPAGFMKSQLDNLLITNGRSEQQHLLVMRIVRELVTKGYPSLIFDFTGEWSRIIRSFQGTNLEDSFLYYKIGKTFNLDLIHSGIPYDQNNIDYLDYMFEAYANCFKKDDRTIEIFKNSLKRSLDAGEDLSTSTIALDLLSKPDWKKREESAINSVINFFHEFSRDELNFFHIYSETSTSQNLINDILTSKQTNIIDLSQPSSLEKKAFLMFVILAKCIHYIKNNQDFNAKFLILPHIDVIFDAFFLDKNMRYGRINKFFDPLRNADFGLICMASQARYLHSNLFTDFDNIICFKATDSRDIAILKNTMGLDTVHGTGIYSKTRNESYQVKYLMSMRSKDALMKRDDIYQPFPIEADWGVFENSPVMTWVEIISYMRQQGYDLEFAERKLLAQAKKTVFEKDFGNYSTFIDEIIAFLGDLRTMDQIGNIYAETIKKELKIRLNFKLSKLTQNKKQKKQIRDDIFQILLQHEYLKEHHPAQASGSESIRTSYYVGPQFDKALEDYIQVKKQISPTVEVIQQQSDGVILPDNPISDRSLLSKTTLDSHKLQEVIAKEIGETLFFDLFEIYKAINHKDYRTGLEKAQEYLTHFIFQVYNEYYDVDYVITKSDLERFISDLTHSKGFPFSYDEFKKYMNLCESICFTEDNLEETIQTIYTQLEMIHNKIKNYIYSN